MVRRPAEAGGSRVSSTPARAQRSSAGDDPHVADLGPIQELAAAVTCPRCSRLLSDPVSWGGCGHSVCRGCSEGTRPSPDGRSRCPNCRLRSRGPVSNPTLAELVAIALALSAAPGGGRAGAAKKAPAGTASEGGEEAGAAAWVAGDSDDEGAGDPSGNGPVQDVAPARKRRGGGPAGRVPAKKGPGQGAERSGRGRVEAAGGRRGTDEEVDADPIWSPPPLPPSNARKPPEVSPPVEGRSDLGAAAHAGGKASGPSAASTARCGLGPPPSSAPQRAGTSSGAPAGPSDSGCPNPGAFGPAREGRAAPASEAREGEDGPSPHPTPASSASLLRSASGSPGQPRGDASEAGVGVLSDAEGRRTEHISESASMPSGGSSLASASREPGRAEGARDGERATPQQADGAGATGEASPRGGEGASPLPAAALIPRAAASPPLGEETARIDEGPETSQEGRGASTKSRAGYEKVADPRGGGAAASSGAQAASPRSEDSSLASSPRSEGDCERSFPPGGVPGRQEPPLRLSALLDPAGPSPRLSAGSRGPGGQQPETSGVRDRERASLRPAPGRVADVTPGPESGERTAPSSPPPGPPPPPPSLELEALVSEIEVLQVAIRLCASVPCVGGHGPGWGAGQTTGGRGGFAPAGGVSVGLSQLLEPTPPLSASASSAPPQAGGWGRETRGEAMLLPPGVNEVSRLPRDETTAGGSREESQASQPSSDCPGDRPLDTPRPSGPPQPAGGVPVETGGRPPPGSADPPDRAPPGSAGPQGSPKRALAGPPDLGGRAHPPHSQPRTMLDLLTMLPGSPSSASQLVAARPTRPPPRRLELALVGPPRERALWREVAERATLAMQRGGVPSVVSEVVSSSTTHTVVETDDAGQVRRRTSRYLAAIAVGAWVLSPAWLEAVAERGAWVAEGPFEVQGDPAGPHGATLARENRARGGRPLMHAFRVRIELSSAQGSLPAAELARLVALAGGEVVDATGGGTGDLASAAGGGTGVPAGVTVCDAPPPPAAGRPASQRASTPGRPASQRAPAPGRRRLVVVSDAGDPSWTRASTNITAGALLDSLSRHRVYF